MSKDNKSTTPNPSPKPSSPDSGRGGRQDKFGNNLPTFQNPPPPPPPKPKKD